MATDAHRQRFLRSIDDFVYHVANGEACNFVRAFASLFIIDQQDSSVAKLTDEVLLIFNKCPEAAAGATNNSVLAEAAKRAIAARIGDALNLIGTS